MFICSTVLFINDEPHGYHLLKTANGFTLAPANVTDGTLPQITASDGGGGAVVAGTEDADLIAQVQKLIQHNKSGELEEAMLAAP